jgi:hypothetical protein
MFALVRTKLPVQSFGERPLADVANCAFNGYRNASADGQVEYREKDLPVSCNRTNCDSRCSVEGEIPRGRPQTLTCAVPPSLEPSNLINQEATRPVCNQDSAGAVEDSPKSISRQNRTFHAAKR